MTGVTRPPARELASLLASKYTFAEAAARLGVNEHTFSKWIRDVAETRKSGPRPVSPPSKQRLLAVLRDRTNQEAAKHYGVSYKTLARWVREYNIEHRLFDQEDMISLAAAAREVNVSRMSMSNWFRRGIIPGARKVNGTRVMVPASSVVILKMWRAGALK